MLRLKIYPVAFPRGRKNLVTGAQPAWPDCRRRRFPGVGLGWIPQGQTSLQCLSTLTVDGVQAEECLAGHGLQSFVIHSSVTGDWP